MKRIIPILLAMCMLLSGCMCMEGTVTIRADGSATVTTYVGMTVEAVNEMTNSGMDLGFEPTTQLIRDGRVYIGEYDTVEYEDIMDFNSQGLYIRKDGQSFSLMVDMSTAQEELGDVTDTEDAEMYEYIMSQSYIQYIFNFPLPVTQTSGPSNGVTIDGNKLSLDILTASPTIYTFYSGQVGRFTDVAADAWYYGPVQAMQATGLVNGYGDGKFGPEDKITLAAICTIIARVNGVPVGSYTPDGYWAEKAIDYCIENGYVTNKGSVTPANYDVHATREEVTAAISRAYAGFNAIGPYTSGWQDNASHILYQEQGYDALRLLYEKTGYSVYIVTANGNEDIDIEGYMEKTFGTNNNGVVIALQYNGDKVTNLSLQYYMYDAAKYYIAGLFDDNADPIRSLLNNIDQVKWGREDYDKVSIPDVADIDPMYVNDIKTAYSVGLCHGKDTDGTFYPKSSITRAEVCQLFYNIHWVQPGVS